MNKPNDANELAFENLPPWIATMRRAAMGAVNEDDIREMVANQVKKAKEGNRDALKFIFDTVLAGAQMRGATFVQNNYASDGEAEKPTAARPGTQKKIKEMQRRLAAHAPLTRGDDGPEVDLR